MNVYEFIEELSSKTFVIKANFKHEDFGCEYYRESKGDEIAKTRLEMYITYKGEELEDPEATPEVMADIYQRMKNFLEGVPSDWRPINRYLAIAGFFPVICRNPELFLMNFESAEKAKRFFRSMAVAIDRRYTWREYGIFEGFLRSGNRFCTDMGYSTGYFDFEAGTLQPSDGELDFGEDTKKAMKNYNAKLSRCIRAENFGLMKYRKISMEIGKITSDFSKRTKKQEDPNRVIEEGYALFTPPANKTVGKIAYSEEQYRKDYDAIIEKRRLLSKNLPSKEDYKAVEDFVKDKLSITGSVLDYLKYDADSGPEYRWRVDYHHPSIEGRRFNLSLHENLESVKFGFCVNAGHHTLSNAVLVHLHKAGYSIPRTHL